MNEHEECPSCIGTGIGNPHVERSVCSACGGSGVRRPARQFVDEDRWAWNHFDPDAGDDADGATAAREPHQFDCPALESGPCDCDAYGVAPTEGGQGNG